MAMASFEGGPEPLKYQTLALKVSIHCEGCKRKVKKVLQSIEGVYHTTIDIQQQKVTVVGNVDPNSLVRKLNKTGKHAELWPEPPIQNPPGGGGGGGGSGGGGGKKNKNKKKSNNNNNNSNSHEPQKQNENSEPHQASSSDEETSPEENSEKPLDRENHEKEKTEGGAVTVMHTPTLVNNPLPPTIQVGGGTGAKKKKKKKKKNNHNNNNNNNNGGNNSGGGGGEGTELSTQEMPVNAIVSHGFIGGGAGGGHVDAFGYPGGGVAAPHVPSYVVTYTTVQPGASFGGAYHNHPSAVGPPAGNAHHHGGCFYPPAVVTTVPAGGGGSYYMFSEENANACALM